MAAKVADFHREFADAEEAVEWVKMHIPEMRKVYEIGNGHLLIRTKSISFASMDQVSFNSFYEKALRLWTKEIGCDPEALLDASPQA